MIEDAKIVELFFNRNEQGVQELDSKYGRLFRKLSYNILQNREDAEECVNDSYLGAWYKIPPEKPLSLVTYVCRIVRNLSLKRYYAVTAQKRDSRLCIALEEMEDCLADMNGQEAYMEAQELSELLEKFLDTLTEENRVIFLRRYWFGDSCRDIGTYVGMTEKNISVRLTRIREKMKNYMKEQEAYV